MSVIKRMRKQEGVYWEQGTPDGYGGFNYPDGIRIKCRWEDVVVELAGFDKNKLVSSTTVYVDRKVVTGGYLSLYEDGMDLTVNPETIKTAFQIKRFNEVPNFKNTEMLMIAYL